ncbi:MAG: M20/M25/M40 family metallo-hydrolase, partial [Pseudomonadota bacterium]
MIKKILLGMLGAITLLVAIVIIRTLNYGNAQPYEAVTLPDVPAYDVNLAARRVGEAIRFPTMTVASGDPRPGQEGPWLDFQAWMETTYPAFHAAANKEIVPGGYSVLYTWTGSDESLAPLMLMAHQDVVPVNIGTEGDWDAPPFSGDIVDGYIYGRGAIDNKGALVSQLEALDALAKTGFAPRRTILYLLGHDEEVSGSGAAAGVALLKSRGIAPVMALDEGLLGIEYNAMTGGPLALIGVAEKGYLTLRLTVTAQGGHSSTPPQNSATVRLARALIALDENQMPSDLSKEPVSTLFSSLGNEMPFLLRMAFANQWLFGGVIDSQMSQDPSTNAMIRTTTAPTMLAGSAKENVLAQRASAIVNFRIHPNDSEGDVLAHIQRLTADIEGLSVTTAQQGIRGTG